MRRKLDITVGSTTRNRGIETERKERGVEMEEEGVEKEMIEAETEGQDGRKRDRETLHILQTAG